MFIMYMFTIYCKYSVSHYTHFSHHLTNTRVVPSSIPTSLAALSSMPRTIAATLTAAACTATRAATYGEIVRLISSPAKAGVSITLGPHEAGVWVKHPSLTIPVPSSGEPSRHLGSSYQRGVSILSPLIADLSGLWGSSMQVMHGRLQGLFSRWQGG